MSAESIAGFAVGLVISLAGIAVFGVLLSVLSDRSAVFVHEMREKQAEIDGSEPEGTPEVSDIAGGASSLSAPGQQGTNSGTARNGRSPHASSLMGSALDTSEYRRGLGQASQAVRRTTGQRS